ncbi:MAG: homoserine O-acetyltransferase [Leptolyngbya sp. DLM2.Bin15]|nr:MAG: homoserine O-acetyltransferase [Leptolyngbya sp. DLM2.Bin15]
MSIGPVKTQFFQLTAEDPFQLESGEVLESVTLAYETYGTLNADASNAILVFHALTGSQHAAGTNVSIPGIQPLWTEDCVLGWWDDFIGSGKALNTDHYFIICVNYLGSCYGSTGPRSVNPRTGKPYGSKFPQVSAGDVVRSQLHLLDYLGIDCLHGVIGGSLGGMLALILATSYPQRVKTVIPIATGLATTPLHRVHNFEQILAIRNDPNFRNGDYYDAEPPKSGVILARMISHKTFISLNVMEHRARQEITVQEPIGQFYNLSHPIESYMYHQGQKFAERFDANSYLRIMDMWQRLYFPSSTQGMFSSCIHQQYLVFGIDSDVCFYPEEQAAIAQALKQDGVNVKYITVHSDKGHDAFLLEPDLFSPYIQFVLS